METESSPDVSDDEEEASKSVSNPPPSLSTLAQALINCIVTNAVKITRDTEAGELQGLTLTPAAQTNGSPCWQNLQAAWEQLSTNEIQFEGLTAEEIALAADLSSKKGQGDKEAQEKAEASQGSGAPGVASAVSNVAAAEQGGNEIKGAVGEANSAPQEGEGLVTGKASTANDAAAAESRSGKSRARVSADGPVGAESSGRPSQTPLTGDLAPETDDPLQREGESVLNWLRRSSAQIDEMNVTVKLKTRGCDGQTAPDAPTSLLAAAESPEADLADPCASRSRRQSGMLAGKTGSGFVGKGSLIMPRRSVDGKARSGSPREGRYGQREGRDGEFRSGWDDEERIYRREAAQRGYWAGRDRDGDRWDSREQVDCEPGRAGRLDRGDRRRGKEKMPCGQCCCCLAMLRVVSRSGAAPGERSSLSGQSHSSGSGCKASDEGTGATSSGDDRRWLQELRQLAGLGRSVQTTRCPRPTLNPAPVTLRPVGSRLQSARADRRAETGLTGQLRNMRSDMTHRLPPTGISQSGLEYPVNEFLDWQPRCKKKTKKKHGRLSCRSEKRISHACSQLCQHQSENMDSRW